MESNRKLTSNFVNPPGIAALFLLAVLFYHFGLRDAAGPALLFALLFLLAWLWNQFALSHLNILVPAGRLCAFPGSTLYLPCQVFNQKFLPLMWMEVLFALREDSCILPAAPELEKPVWDRHLEKEVPGACARLTWLLWHQESALEIPMKAIHRGICSFSEVYAASGDGFGLGVRETCIPLEASSQLIVYPAVLPVQISGLVQNISDLEAGRGGFLEDVTLLKMNRAYQPGDSVKRIGWRQLARQNVLMTNVYETIFPKMMTFYLDLPSFRRKTTEKNDLNGQDVILWHPLADQREAMISITASCILKLADSGICCGLVIPGYGSSSGVIQYPGRHGSEVEELFYSLAAVSYRAEDGILPEEALTRSASSFGTFCVITRSFTSMSLSDKTLSLMNRVMVIAAEETERDPCCPWRLIHKDELTIKEAMTNANKKPCKRKNE